MPRSEGIGGTDISKIAEASEYGGPMDVYLEKTGIAPPIEDNEAMWFGREAEPMLRKRYEKETGYKTSPPETTPLIHPKYSWYRGSLDDRVLPDGVVDYKTTTVRREWGEPGSGEIPYRHICQGQWYMGLTDAEWCDFAVYFLAPRREFAIYRIERNDELINDLIEIGRDFWENHVVPGIPPPLDASPASKILLNHLYPVSDQDLIPATAEALELAELLRYQTVERDRIVAELTLTQNRLKNLIGDHAGMVGDGWKITWKQSKPRETIDWMGVATEFEPSPELIKKHTQTRPGSRVFRPWFKEEI